jgi:hypothetical protein
MTKPSPVYSHPNSENTFMQSIFVFESTGSVQRLQFGELQFYPYLSKMQQQVSYLGNGRVLNKVLRCN